MRFKFSYAYDDSRFSNLEIEASDYDAAKAQLLSDKPDAKITAVEVRDHATK